MSVCGLISQIEESQYMFYQADSFRVFIGFFLGGCCVGWFFLGGGGWWVGGGLNRRNWIGIFDFASSTRIPCARTSADLPHKRRRIAKRVSVGGQMLKKEC